MVYTTKTIISFHCVHHEMQNLLLWCTPRNNTTEGENGITLSPEGFSQLWLGVDFLDIFSAQNDCLVTGHLMGTKIF